MFPCLLALARTTAALALASAIIVANLAAQSASLDLDFDVSNEGALGERRTLDFTILLKGVTAQVVTVKYAVSNGAGTLPAASGGAACGATTDYIAATGSITFPPLVTRRVVPVTICGDAAFETDERLTFTISGATNASIQTGSVVGTIVNDDPRPVITVTIANQGLATEGNGGPTPVPVTVSLSTPNHFGVSLKLVRGGSAVRSLQCAGNTDVQASADTILVSWPANNNDNWNQPIIVCGDLRDEDNDTFELTAALVVNADVAPASQMRRLVIFDDDPAPSIAVSDVLVTEGAQAHVNITLSAASNRDVTVVLTAGAGTPATGGSAATAGSGCAGLVDFVPASRTLTVPAGALVASQSLDVVTCSNVDFSNNPATLPGPGYTEVFLVTASAPLNATLGKAVGVVAVRDP